MKILFLMHSFLNQGNMHGVGVLTYHLAKQMRDKHEIIIVDRTYQNDLTQEFSIEKKEYDGIRWYTVATPPPASFMLRDHAYKQDILLDAITSIIDTEQGFEIANIHHLASWPTSVMDFIKSKNIPVVLSIHDTWYLCPTINYYNRYHHKICSKTLRETTKNNCEICLKDLGTSRFGEENSLTWYKENIIDERAYRSMFQKADAVIFPTERCKAYYDNELLVHQNTEIVPYYIDVPPVSKKNHPEHVFGFISNIAFGKGVDIVLNAFSKIKAPDARLNIHGTIYDSRLGNMIDTAIKMDTRIKYHGSYNEADTPLILSDIDTMIVPSFFPESFNLCSYVSVSSKIPLIVSEIAYQKEFLLDGSNCKVFKTNDTKDLSLKMQSSYDEKNKTLTEGFIHEPNIFSKSYLSIYGKLVSNRECYIDGKLIFIAKNTEDIRGLESFRQTFSTVNIICLDEKADHKTLTGIAQKMSRDAYSVSRMPLNIRDIAFDEKNIILRYGNIKINDANTRLAFKHYFQECSDEIANIDSDGCITQENTGLLMIKRTASQYAPKLKKILGNILND